MEDRIIDDEHLPLERKSLLPGTGFFVPDEIHDAREDRRVEREATGASIIVVADPDPDGLACTAIVGAALDAELRIAPEPADDATGDADGTDDRRAAPAGELALIPAGPHDLDDGLGRAAEYGAPGARVFVCDLCPDDLGEIETELAALTERADRVRWFDHHQWERATADAVRAAGVDLVVGESETECTADVAVRSLDAALPDRLVELARATRDHDLWIKEDPRSDDLADYAYWVDDPREYVRTVREHGADLPAEVGAFLEERRVEKEALIDRAVDRAALREVGPWTVGITYGRCSQNEVADALREAGADAAVIVKPAGSASIRGSEAFERCHEVARQVEGGGHPKAAGCKPDVYEDVLDYAHHWTTQGAVAKREILAAFETLNREGGADADADR